jgi:hypothetical protein
VASRRTDPARLRTVPGASGLTDGSTVGGAVGWWWTGTYGLRCWAAAISDNVTAFPTRHGELGVSASEPRARSGVSAALPGLPTSRACGGKARQRRRGNAKLCAVLCGRSPAE